MWRLCAGTVMVVSGLFAFYYAHYHRPELDPMANRVLSRSAYDLLHVGAWALVVLGALGVVAGVRRLWMEERS